MRLLHRSQLKFASLLALLSLLTGCGALTIAQRNQVAGGVLTTIAGRSPTTEIEQIYYLGIFDPQEQLPPLLYRVRVRGQANFLSRTKFASGWLPAAAVDSLVGMQAQADVSRMNLSGNNEAAMNEGAKRLFLFGPEGFRKAPQGHRLAIVMGVSPDAFLGSVDQALGSVAAIQQPKNLQGVSLNVAKFVDDLVSEKDAYQELLLP